MTKPLYAKFDNRDDRGECHRLLERIPPKLRIRWLKWCCERTKLKGGTLGAKVLPGTTGENSMEVYFDFWSLTNEYQFDPLVGLNALVEIVRDWEKGHFKKGSPIKVHLPK